MWVVVRQMRRWYWYGRWGRGSTYEFQHTRGTIFADVRIAACAGRGERKAVRAVELFEKREAGTRPAERSHACVKMFITATQTSSYSRLKYRNFSHWGVYFLSLLAAASLSIFTASGPMNYRLCPSTEAWC